MNSILHLISYAAQRDQSSMVTCDYAFSSLLLWSRGVFMAQKGRLLVPSVTQQHPPQGKGRSWQQYSKKQLKNICLVFFFQNRKIIMNLCLTAVFYICILYIHMCFHMWYELWCIVLDSCFPWASANKQLWLPPSGQLLFLKLKNWAIALNKIHFRKIQKPSFW